MHGTRSQRLLERYPWIHFKPVNVCHVPRSFSLVENGYATVEDIDRACRNNAGYWMTLVGVFGWMDLTGVPAYHTVMKDLFPTLSNNTEVPKMIDEIVKNGGRGCFERKRILQLYMRRVENNGGYLYEFSFDIRKLADKYNKKLNR
jgi:3-hydroxybutyryl-CoA dehydrogenase